MKPLLLILLSFLSFHSYSSASEVIYSGVQTGITYKQYTGLTVEQECSKTTLPNNGYIVSCLLKIRIPTIGDDYRRTVGEEVGIRKMPQCKRDDTDFRTKEARVWKLFYETAKKKKWSNEKLIENRAYLEKRLEEIASKLKSVCTYKYSTIISEDVKHFFIRPYGY